MSQFKIAPVDKIVLSQQHNVAMWFEPACRELSERDTPLTLYDAQKIGLKATVQVFLLREDFRACGCSSKSSHHPGTKPSTSVDQRGRESKAHNVDAGATPSTSTASSLQDFSELSQHAPEPLVETSPDAVDPGSKQHASSQDESNPAVVDREVKALLNKLSVENFDLISDKIICWANKSEYQTDGRTLIYVIRLVFEKATDDAACSKMYARLCRKMKEGISPNVQGEVLREGKSIPMAGAQLFRNHLLKECQEGFEGRWVLKDKMAANRSSENEAAIEATERKGKDDEELALHSDTYRATQKARRQGLSLVKFIAELFKVQMLTELIIHNCVKELLGDIDDQNPGEETLESLCKLLTIVGKSLDSQRGGAHMDIYFARMRELRQNPKVNSRMQSLLTVSAGCSCVSENGN